MTEPVKVFALVAFEGDPGSPQTVFSRIVPVSVVKSKLLFFFKHCFSVAVKRQLAVSFQLNAEPAYLHKNTIAFVLKFRLCALRRQSEVFVKLSAVGKRLKPNGVVMTGRDPDKLVASGKQNAVVFKSCVFHCCTPL